MAQRFFNPAPQFFYSGTPAAPLSGGLMYFYEPGTTTPKDTYSNNGLSVANTNPVVLTSSGVLPNVFLDGPYKVNLTDKNGVQQPGWPRDSVNSVVDIAFAAWDGTVTYGLRATNIVYASDGNYYISIQANNTSHDPTSSPLWWALWPFPAGTNNYVLAYNSAVDGLVEWVPVVTLSAGMLQDYAGLTVPTGYLDCDGSAVSRATYPDLFAAITTSKGTFTVTIAAPGLITLAGHGLETGDVFSATTTGALPTGLVPSTNYYFIKNDANSGWFATTYANAFAATKVTTSGSQSGVHTLRYNPWGISGASDFLLPDFRRRASIGSGGSATETIGNRVGNVGGAETHALTAAENGPHSHTLTNVGVNAGVEDSLGVYNNSSEGTLVTDSSGSGTAHNNMQPSAVVRKIIKT